MGDETRSGPSSKATTPEPGKAPPPPRPPREGGTSSTETAERLAKLSPRHPFRLGMVVGSLVTGAVVLLVIQNSDPVEVQWLVFDFRARLWAVFLVTLAAGGVVWETVKLAVRRGRRRARERKAALRQAKESGPASPGSEAVRPAPKS